VLCDRALLWSSQIANAAPKSGAAQEIQNRKLLEG
jgi:hypothetical protein